MFDFGKRFFFLQVGVQMYEILSADVTTARDICTTVVYQRKRAGPITQRSEDQNLALLTILSCFRLMFKQMRRFKENFFCSFWSVLFSLF